MTPDILKNKIICGEFDKALFELYGKSANLEEIKARYVKAVSCFEETYGRFIDENSEINLFSVPGRSEISGNHTDHNRGKVLAASISLDIIAVAMKTENPEIRIKSEGFCEDIVSLDDVNNIKENERYKASAIIRGMCDGFEKNGYSFGGYYAYTTSNVLKGSGLSSSAAFEVMVGNILNHYYNDGKVSAVDIAKIAQYSENEHFGKPCGLMDQTACSVGGFVAIDFKDEKNPIVEKLPFDLDEYSISLCITNTGGNHADLNDDYASIPSDMKKTAKYLGYDVLSETTKENLLENSKNIRETLGDRCFLRALHFFNENERVTKQKEALKNGDIKTFFNGIMESGKSSAEILQNVYTIKNVNEQGLTVALALASEVLDGVGNSAYRVHGGGFAGTIQSFVPHEKVEEFTDTLESVFGKGSVYVLSVRKHGAVMLKKDVLV